MIRVRSGISASLAIAASLCSLMVGDIACGSRSTNTSESPDAAAADATTLGSDAKPASCTHQGMIAQSESAERDDSLGVLFYTATSGTAPAIKRLTFDFYFSLGAADGPQNISFTGENLSDCHTCLLVRRDCESSRCKNGKAFIAQEGKADITALGAVGTSLQGVLQNVVFSEVTINPSGLSTTLVPGGETWCIDQYAIDTVITAPQ